MKFKEIKNNDELKRYLKSYSARLQNSKYIYHYTSIDKFAKILKSKTLYLGKLENMNDILEYEKSNKKDAKKLFFISFASNIDESMSMWSMYAGSWDKGIKIKIPKKTFTDWATNLDCVYLLCDNKIKQQLSIDPKKDIEIASVAYSNSLLEKKENNKEILIWSNVVNRKIKLDNNIKYLTGFVKSDAWSYEKEVRLKFIMHKNANSYKNIALPLTDELISSMEIVLSPLFKEKAKNILIKEGVDNKIIDNIKFSNSIYTGLIKVNNGDNRCEK